MILADFSIAISKVADILSIAASELPELTGGVELMLFLLASVGIYLLINNRLKSRSMCHYTTRCRDTKLFAALPINSNQRNLFDAVKCCEIRFHNKLIPQTNSDIKVIFISGLFLVILIFMYHETGLQRLRGVRQSLYYLSTRVNCCEKRLAIRHFTCRNDSVDP